jgi:hypothetical protein
MIWDRSFAWGMISMAPRDLAGKTFISVLLEACVLLEIVIYCVARHA